MCPYKCQYKQRNLPNPLAVELLSRLKCGYFQINCNKCQLKYQRKDRHSATLCLQNQIKNQNGLFESRLTAATNDFKLQIELLMNSDKEKQTLIQNLALEIQISKNKITQQQEIIPRLEQNDQKKEATIKKLNQFHRIYVRKVIQFDNIPNATKVIGLVPNGYCGTNWNNVAHMHISTAQEYDKQGYCFTNAFSPSNKYVAFNSGGNSMSILSTTNMKTFTAESFEASSATNNDLNFTISALRNGHELCRKAVTLTNALTLITLNWTNIDTIRFQIPAEKYIAVSRINLLS
ncbi:unnamed protein product [Didymodactylos carnosus]|uniref:Uncharacterized protein n=1 Tax=Didymodactylos carnosus TaxID=1234261 RepID=A0A814GAL5_9BILA|nr:unnamed protein product [Didymodactylos carnosus]CAF3765644.1 unnamed protein product [Didymodactylos carnosus]